MNRDKRMPVLLYLVTEDWYFCSHRLPLARAALAAGYRVVVVTRVRDHAAPIVDAGLELRHLSLERRSINPFTAVRALFSLLSIYREVRPSLAHHVAIKPVLLGTVVACLAGVPRVVNALAGLGFVFASSTVRARALRPLARGALAFALGRRRVSVIVQNEVDAAEVSRLGVASGRISIVRGSGVDLVRFAPTPEPPPPIVASVVSRMLVDKGITELVAAARLLRARGEAVEIHLVGAPDPDNPSSIEESTLRSWQREGVVRWHGATDDVPGVWARSHLGVLPSYREGLPKSLLEAGACARPLIATNVAGCRDVVVPDMTGILVPPRDADALAKAIATLAHSPKLRRRLGDGARAHVVANFSEQRIVAQTLAIYGQASPTVAAR